MGCRFPGGSDSPDRYWSFLRSERCAIAETPRHRIDLTDAYDPDPRAPGKVYSRHGAFLDQRPEHFDASFFGISPHEAWPMDPTHRLLLEVAWESLEHAGIAPKSLEGTSTGVFAGASDSEYLTRQARLTTSRDVTAYHGMAAPAFAAGRVSYLLGLEGPAITLDTACSSSLVATLLAVDSLRSGQCDLALAGGSHLIVDPVVIGVLCRLTALSLTGRSRVFDAEADGFVRGEGAGMVVLKRLSQALEDGDVVYATILGGVTNHDGRSTSLSTPRGEAQEKAMRTALAQTGLGPDDFDYVEAHGTGTPVGDPIEAIAIGNVLASDRTRTEPLWIGSGKTNLGHLEAASGVAALMKVALSLHHEEIPAHLNFESPNPHIPWSDYHFDVPTERVAWARGDRRRVAGINSFGLSGTNAHIVVAEAPRAAERPEPTPDRCYVLPISGRSSDAVSDLAASWARALDDETAELRDLCWTASVGRSHNRRRLAVVGRSREELAQSLRRRRDDAVSASAKDDSSIAFLFTGQGAQYAGMGRGLYSSNAAFRRRLDACAEVLDPHLDTPLLSLLFDPASAHLIDRTEYTQPAMLALQLALVDAWAAWGVRPTHVLGHSLGEFAAAATAGVMDPGDALDLVRLRGALMLEHAQPGAMAVAFTDEGTARDIIADVPGVSVAALNAPTNTVLSGSFDDIESIAGLFEAKSVGVQRLEVSHAFHSALMDPMLDPFEAAVRERTLSEPHLELVSNVTGELGAAGLFTRTDYWRRHVREPVRFADSIVALQAAGVRTIVEIGPQPTLLGMAGLSITKRGVSLIPSLRKAQPDDEQLLSAVGQLYELGHPVDWEAIQSVDSARPAAAPTYQFQRKSFWFPVEGSRSDVPEGPPPVRPIDMAKHPLLGNRLRVPGLPGVTYQSFIEAEEPRWLSSYRIRTSHFVPLGAQLELVHAGARSGLRWSNFELVDVEVHEPFGLPKKDGRICQLSFDEPSDGRCGFKVISMARTGSGAPRWATHLSGSVRRGEPRGEEPDPAIFTRFSSFEEPTELYANLKADGLRVGDSFAPIHELRRMGGEILARVEIAPSLARDTKPYAVHPTLLEAVAQIGTAFDDSGQPGTWIVSSIGQLWLGERATEIAWIHATPTHGGDGDLALEITCLDVDGASVARASEVRHTHSTHTSRIRRVTEDEWALGMYWHEAPPESRELDAHGHWLVLEGATSVGAETAAALEARGGTVHRWAIGSGEDGPEGVPAVDRSSDGWIAKILDAVAQGPSEESRRLRGVVWTGSISDVAAHPAPDAAYDRAADVAGDAADIIRELGDRDLLDGPFLIATAGVTDLTPTGGVRALEGAGMWGMARVMRVEYLTTDTRVLDLDPGTPQEWANEIVHELQSRDGETRVARRGGDRFVPRLEYFRDSGPTREHTIRPDRAYFVTGGLGGLGRAIAHWLHAEGAGAILLNARRAPNEQTAQWIRELRAQGSRVEVVLGDVARSDDAARVRAEVAEMDIPLGGIFHLAGTLDRRHIRDLDRDAIARMLAPKVAGTWHMHQLSLEHPVELFVLFGSMGAILGSPTQGSYAAANAYLPAMAHWRREQRLPVSCFEWGLWAGGGMGDDVGDRELDVYAAAGHYTMDPGQAVSLLGDHLREQTHRVIVAASDWGRASEVAGDYTFEPVLSELWVPVEAEKESDAGAAVARLQELGSLEEEERTERLLTLLLDHVAEVLGIDASALGVDDDVRMSGLDSLMALDLRHRVEAELGLILPTPGPMGTLTPNVLAATLADQVPAALAEAQSGDEDSTEGDWVEGEL